MDREKYLENTGGIVRMRIEELLDENEQLKEELSDYKEGVEGLKLSVCDLRDERDRFEQKIERLENRVEEIDDYDSGILNDYGGGNINWWMDYIRSEVSRCNDHWRQALKEE